MAREQAKSVRKMRDVNHKVSRQAVDWGVTTGQSKMILSQPTGIAKAKGRRAQRQRNGYWEYGQQSRMIEYKAEGLIEIERDEETGRVLHVPNASIAITLRAGHFAARSAAGADTGIWWGPATSWVGMNPMPMSLR